MRRHVHDELARAHVGRQAVVLGHVADQPADLLAPGGDVVAQHPRAAGGRLEQAEQDLDQRRLAGTVGADESRHALADLDVEVGQGMDLARSAW